MGMIVIGVIWLLTAAGNALHIEAFLQEEHRGTKAGRNFQRRNVLPYTILGLVFLLWAWLNGRFGLDPLVFGIGILVLAAVPVVMLYKNRNRLLQEYREEQKNKHTGFFAVYAAKKPVLRLFCGKAAEKGSAFALLFP